MTNPINLYVQSRIKEELPFNRVEQHTSHRLESGKTKEHEILSLRKIVDELMICGVGVRELDGFFFGYHIPQIGKEFDLLKFSKDRAINIELKSQAVPIEQITAQLVKNRHYLSHLKKEKKLYTVITDSMTCYELLEDGKVKSIDFSCVAKTVKAMGREYLSDIDSMFRASEFLVSPFGTPEKFVRGQYFLTNAQEQIKKKIVERVENISAYGFISLTGRPGTGKTLLLYDIAKYLSQKGKTLVINCGGRMEVPRFLNERIENFHVISVEHLNENSRITDGYKYVLLDESQRINPELLEGVLRLAYSQNKVCIFSSDPEQVLSQGERINAIWSKIHALPCVSEYELSEKIRTNISLASFISSVRNLNKKPREKRDYSSVSLAYANDEAEACRLIEYFRSDGYVFISYSDDDVYLKHEDDYDTHHVIGQEFDKVLILMDGRFYYDENGVLQGVPPRSFDYLYPNLFYQGISRVREKIALIVVGEKNLFEKITSVLEF